MSDRQHPKINIDSEAKKEQELQTPSRSWRQRFHFMAPEGWMNDPNGCIYFRGQYHLFYQHNPLSPYWGEMYWGHAVSDDLFHWQPLPIALSPDRPYDSYERGGCFSGSAIEKDGKLYLMYTGTARDGNGFVQTQCLAWSEDGVHFEKYGGNPVISQPPSCGGRDFRDPKVWEYQGRYYMVCGTSHNGYGKAVLYCSKDLLHWEYVNVLAESRGEWGSMWECPDFFPLGDKYVLMFSPMHAGERTSVYMVGDMDYERGRFHPALSGEIDWGLDFYAPQTFSAPNNRRIMIAWANEWEWMPWFKGWGPTHQEGWCGAFTTPREISLSADGRLSFAPVEELKKLRYGGQMLQNLKIDDQGLNLHPADPAAFELLLTVNLAASTSGKLLLMVKSNGEYATKIIFDFQKAELIVDRGNADKWSGGISRSSLLLQDKEHFSIRLIADVSSIEVYADGYRTVHSCNVYPQPDQTTHQLKTMQGDLFIDDFQLYSLKKTIR